MELICNLLILLGSCALIWTQKVIVLMLVRSEYGLKSGKRTECFQRIYLVEQAT